MKNFLLLLCLFAALFSSAQSDLDDKITEFATSNKLYNKKLQKLVLIYEDQTLSETERLQQWNKMYQKWDSKGATESFNAEFELIEAVPGLHNNYHEKTGGYNLEYLLFRLNESSEKGKISSTNKIIIEQILIKQWKEKAEVKADVQAMSTTISNFFNSNPKLNQLRELIDGGSFASMPISFKNYNDFFYLLTDTEQSQFKQYLEDSRITFWDFLSKQEHLNFRAQTFVGEELRMFPSSGLGDSLLYTDFTKVPVISSYIRLKMFLHTYFKFEKDALDRSELSKMLEKKLRLNAFDFLFLFENYYNSYDVRQILQTNENSAIQKLLVAAYNDAYYFLKQTQKNAEEWNNKRLDFSNLNLSQEKKKVIDAILSSDKAITKVGLEAALTDDIFQSIEWDLEFKLACYFALYYKSIDLQNEWNNSSIQLDPFAKDKIENQRSFNNFSEEDWQHLKDKTREMLESLGYGNTRFVITYDGQMKVNCWPYEERMRGLDKFVLNEAKGIQEMPYFRFIVETGKAEKHVVEKVRPPVPVHPIEGVYAVPPPPPPPAQTQHLTVPAEILEFPDEEASFPGGTIAMKKWIEENLIYPEISRELGDKGRVYVTFVVEPDGSISGVEVMRGGLTPELNQEAKRLVLNMPKWTPGKVKGEPVRTRCRIPITFTL